MTATTRVDFHCHSTHSDGGLTPDQLVERLRAAGVAFAALADHDTIDGLVVFEQAAERHGIGVITGVEITVQCQGEEAHLLGYGFDPSNSELRDTLRSIRQSHPESLPSLADSMRRPGLSSPGNGQDNPGSAAPDGRLDIADGIALIHRAGGQAFLAHPLNLQPDLARLEELLAELKTQGLDGVEALYAPASTDDQKRVHALAGRLGLLVSGGSDYHAFWAGNSMPPGVDMPTEVWRQFRTAVCSGGHCVRASLLAEAARDKPVRLRRRHIAFHIVFPTMLAIALFAGAIFAVLLPGFERSLLDRKREMIQELTNSAWSILAEYYQDEQDGLLTRQEAQEMAKRRVEYLRYGRERKDYFWLQDMHPRIIMHPYRKDLNGQDVSEYRDPTGVRIFVEFAELVRRQEEGHIQYVWQWKDDPTRLEAKESYIKAFAPWGWVIGTGLYIEDVEHELARMKRSLLGVSAGIFAVIALLLLYVMQHSLRLERARRQAETRLRESTERYRSVVEATTEGTLLVLGNRCRYANPQLLQMLGYSDQELELLEIFDVLPADDNTVAWENLNRLQDGQEPSGGFEGALRRRDGELVDCVLAASRIAFGGRSGFILLAKEISSMGADGAAERERLERLAQLADVAALGLFRAELGGRGRVVHANSTAVALLRTQAAGSRLQLADVFPYSSEYADFVAQLRRDGQTDRDLHLPLPETSTRTVHLSAQLGRDEDGEVRFVDGRLEDVTESRRRDTEREALIEHLQSSLLFLHEPLTGFGETPLTVDLQTPVQGVAALMSAHPSSVALVRSEEGPVVGIVTDRDLRVRVVGTGRNCDDPIYRIMSSPLITISEQARVYEALLLMEEEGVQHLAITDEAGQIVSMVHNKELLQFRSYGATVLTREIARAPDPEQVVALCKRVPELAKALLDSGASPRNITRMLTVICDTATVRFMDMAMDRLGPAPTRFVFVGMGSHGRQELTLFSDQDNAIIHASVPEADAERVSDYFLQMGQLVNTWLDQAGYPLCRGEVMARNPKWCQPLEVWEAYFRDWIRKAEPLELRQFTIFFDFRPIYGSVELAQQLRQYVNQTVHGTPAFFPHFAQSSLEFKPPVRLFGKIIAGTGVADSSGQLNLKEAMMPLVNFARVYSLRHGVNDTHTMDRLEALAAGDVLQASSLAELDAAYDFIMRLRLRHHSNAIHAGQKPDNLISPRDLRTVEETLLRQFFAQITAIQSRISYDFLGGGT